MKRDITLLFLFLSIAVSGQPSSSIYLSFQFFSSDGKKLNKDAVCSGYVEKGSEYFAKRTYFELCSGEYISNTYDEKTGWFHLMTSNIYPPFYVEFIHNFDTMMLVLDIIQYESALNNFAIDSLIFTKGVFNISLKNNIESYSNDTAYLSFTADSSASAKLYLKSFVEKGDGYFGRKDFDGAIYYYHAANKIDSKNEYVIDKINKCNTEIDKIKSAGYKNAISEADSALNRKNYQLAREKYIHALSFKYMDKYALDLINLCVEKIKNPEPARVSPIVPVSPIVSKDTLPYYASTIRGKYVIDSVGFTCEGWEFPNYKTVVVTGENNCLQPDTLNLTWDRKRNGYFSIEEKHLSFSKLLNEYSYCVQSASGDTIIVYPARAVPLDKKKYPIPEFRLIKKFDRDSFITTKDTFDLKDGIKVIANVSAPRNTYRFCDTDGPFPFKLFYKMGNEWKLYVVDKRFLIKCHVGFKPIIIADKDEFIFPFIYHAGTYYIEAGTFHPKHNYQTGVITSNIFIVK